MNLKKFLKPTIFKILVFLFIGVFYLYFAQEDTCAASFYFSFCFNEHGFPFSYIVTGEIDNAMEPVKALFLGDYFKKYDGILFNPAAFILDLILIYLLASFITLLISKQTKT